MRSRRCPDGRVRDSRSAGSTTTDVNRGKIRLPDQGRRSIINGDEVTVRPDRLKRRGADRLQRVPSRAATVSAFMNVHHADDLPRRGQAYPGLCSPERGDVASPVNVIAPKGSIFNPKLPAGDVLRAASVRLQRAVDLALRCAGTCRCRSRSTAGSSGTYSLHLLLRLRRRGRRVLGLPRGRTRAPTAAATAATASNSDRLA